MGNTIKVLVSYDGGTFQTVSNYFKFTHTIGKRISFQGIHNFLATQIAKKEDVAPTRISVVESHYFVGRFSTDSVVKNRKLENERKFDEVLMRAGVTPHYLPRMPVPNEENANEIEKGVDVDLALTSMETVERAEADILVLFACDGDYAPLLRKLRANGIGTMLLSWNFQYVDGAGCIRKTKTSTFLEREATYVLDMCKLIQDALKSSHDEEGVLGIFLPDVVRLRAKPENEINALHPDELNAWQPGLINYVTPRGFGQLLGEKDQPHFFSSANCVDCKISDLHAKDRVLFVLGPSYNPQYHTQAVRVRRV